MINIKFLSKYQISIKTCNFTWNTSKHQGNLKEIELAMLESGYFLLTRQYIHIYWWEVE